MNEYTTVADFIKEFRRRIGDETCDIPVSSIISWLNVALRRFARAKGMGKLFKYQDTFELARMDTDGAAAASWILNGDCSKKVGMILDIESMLIIDSKSCGMESLNLCYMPFAWFRKAHPFPENNKPGIPCDFTVNQMGGDLKIIFDKPIDKPKMIDMVYQAFHPRITSESDTLRIPYAFQDILQEMVFVIQQQESADFSTSLALLEQWDYYVGEARELLYQQPSAFPNRNVRGSF